MQQREKAGSAFCGIAVMAKASIPGRTKTRLVPPLSYEEAASFNTAFLRDIAENLLAAAGKASLVGYMAYGPPGSEAFFREHLPASIGLIEASGPDLGNCLITALEAQFSRGHAAACALNADSPTLPAAILLEAVRHLTEPGDRVVLGPSTDGGYYFVGLKTLHRRLFEDIAWSTAEVTGQTLVRAYEIGLPVTMLPEWYDVDDGEGLLMLAAELLEGRHFINSGLTPSTARHSAALLRQMARDAKTAGRLGIAWQPSPQKAPL